MKPLTKALFAGTAANHWSEYPSGGNDGISWRKNASHVTSTSGSRMKPSVMAAAPFKSHRPTGMGREGSAITAARSCATAGVMGVVQPVLGELAALHDRAEILALFLEQGEVLQRIAVDHD